jgi:hypothetical protein
MSWKPGQREAFVAELAGAIESEQRGNAMQAFRHLERAHVIGQRRVLAHTRVHGLMLLFGVRHRDTREVLGQLLRMIAALTKTLIWVPKGNTGAARVSAFRPMPVPEDLQRLID